jgi:hypothetical protein
MPWVLLGFFLGYVVTMATRKSGPSTPDIAYSYMVFDGDNKLLGTFNNENEALEVLRKVKNGTVKRMIRG